MNLPQAVLQSRRAKPFYGRHPWVYAGAIARLHGEPGDGAEIDLVSHAGHFVARGLYNSRSKIRVRLYSWSQETPLDQSFFHARLVAAIRLRKSILQYLGPMNACRLVFSEGDGLSGLTVDCYDRWLVIQFTSLGLAQRSESIADSLEELLQPEGIYLRTERGIGLMEGLELQDGLTRGSVPAEPIIIQEGEIHFHVHLAQGQKTGFYLDQRDNRFAVAPYCAGRRVLDGFCYTGGFGLHAARAGATEVIGVDVSEPALALARENAGLNGFTAMDFIRQDVFNYLDSRVQSGEHFGVVILDPPKFARTRSAIAEAVRGYRRLQTLSLKLLEPDGILVMCCCSGLISMTMLEELTAQVAAEEHREVQILERRGQSPDHPVLATCPETNYLKCLICRVL